jgi:hypothetical protein
LDADGRTDGHDETNSQFLEFLYRCACIQLLSVYTEQLNNDLLYFSVQIEIVFEANSRFSKFCERA